MTRRDDIKNGRTYKPQFIKGLKRDRALRRQREAHDHKKFIIETTKERGKGGHSPKHHYPNNPRPKLYVILKKGTDGKIYGLNPKVGSEHWSDTVYLWRREPPNHYMKPDGRFIARVHSKTCPVEIALGTKGGVYSSYPKIVQNQEA